MGKTSTRNTSPYTWEITTLTPSTQTAGKISPSEQVTCSTLRRVQLTQQKTEKLKVGPGGVDDKGE